MPISLTALETSKRINAQLHGTPQLKPSTCSTKQRLSGAPPRSMSHLKRIGLPFDAEAILAAIGTGAPFRGSWALLRVPQRLLLRLYVVSNEE